MYGQYTGELTEKQTLEWSKDKVSQYFWVPKLVNRANTSGIRGIARPRDRESILGSESLAPAKQKFRKYKAMKEDGWYCFLPGKGAASGA